ncbi:MAG TPA: hypothetical protein VG649_12890 [Candidatus Angelobacter sp.]|nr:hypothetical protein [Candidatus Angelobacter sp.]
MLKLLLHEHISPKVAHGLVRRNPKLVARYILEWEKGRFRGQSDFACLQEAARQGLTFVTYDLRTIPPVLKVWAEEGRSHSGVIFIDEKSIFPANIGGIVLALAKLVDEAGSWSWTNRVYFLGAVMWR